MAADGAIGAVVSCKVKGVGLRSWSCLAPCGGKGLVKIGLFEGINSGESPTMMY